MICLHLLVSPLKFEPFQDDDKCNYKHEVLQISTQLLKNDLSFLKTRKLPYCDCTLFNDQQLTLFLLNAQPFFIRSVKTIISKEFYPEGVFFSQCYAKRPLRICNNFFGTSVCSLLLFWTIRKNAELVGNGIPNLHL